jgi:chorismate mutase/prephenate dehydratase
VEEGVIMENAIESIRKEIDGIDGELLALFVRRMEAAGKMAEVKRALGRPVLDPARERSILTRVTEAAGPELENEARLLFTTLMAISRGSQRAALSDASPFAKELAAEFDEPAPAETALLPRLKKAFVRVFCPSDELKDVMGGGLHDTWRPGAEPDLCIRPNQIFAVAVPCSPLSQKMQAAVTK